MIGKNGFLYLRVVLLLIVCGLMTGWYASQAQGQPGQSEQSEQSKRARRVNPDTTEKEQPQETKPKPQSNPPAQTTNQPAKPDAQQPPQQGQKPPVKSQIKDPESGAYVPAELLSPVEIKKADVKSVVSAGFVSKKDLCAGKYAALCAENGI